MQKSTVIHQQPLLCPITLECNPSEELIIQSYLDIFELNGFHIQCKDTNPVGQRLLVYTIPVSKNTKFSIDDIHDLAGLLSQEIFQNSFQNDPDRNNSYFDSISNKNKNYDSSNDLNKHVSKVVLFNENLMSNQGADITTNS